MSNILQEINNYKKEIIIRDKKLQSLAFLKNKTESNKAISNFSQNIEDKIAKQETAIIAEIKQQSPSQGVLKEQNFSVAGIAQSYKKGGASCISVLTDEKYFSGKNEFVEIAKQASGLPILRKDFIIDEYQIYQAKAIGADAILLIMASLSQSQAIEYEQIANSIGLDVLVESFNEEELEQSLNLKTKLIGINNRNLKTLATNISTIFDLQHKIPKDKILICESGINAIEDFEQVKKTNINAFLIGGFLMQENDPAKTLKSLCNFST